MKLDLLDRLECGCGSEGAGFERLWWALAVEVGSFRDEGRAELKAE